MEDTILIKKYANRRLYDTDKSACVTLNQVSDMIKNGRQVKVVDAKTKEDMTAFILTQIILEEAKKKNVLLPAPVLHLIIRYGDNVLAEFFEKYLKLTIQNYLSYKSAFDEQFKKWLDLSMEITGISQSQHATPFKSFMDLFSKPEEK